MIEYNLIVRLPERYGERFLRYMKVFNAKWQPTDERGVFDDIADEWYYGRYRSYTFRVASCCANQMYHLLALFVAATGVKMLFSDTSEDPFGSNPEPGYWQTETKRWRASLYIVHEFLLYRVTALRKQAMRLRYWRNQMGLRKTWTPDASDTSECPF